MRPFVTLVAFAIAGLPAGARGAEGGPEGTIQIGSGYSEILSTPLPVGKRIELPEGWFRVEGEGVEDGRVGSFTVVASRDDDATPASAADERASPPAAPAPVPAAAPAWVTAPEVVKPCRAERNAYLKDLWKLSGIEVEDPDALIDGLEAGTVGPATAYYWFALSADPFRPLAWSSDLRGRADALVRCVQAARRAAR